MALTRRDFAYALGGGAMLSRMAAASPLLNQAGSKPDRKIGYAIVGLGRISLQHFMPGCKQSQKSQVVALVSGHRDKAEKTAAEYNIPAKIYAAMTTTTTSRTTKTSMPSIWPFPTACMLSTPFGPPTLASTFCARNRWQVLRDSQAMVDACHSAKKKLFIAYRCQYEPTNLRAIELIRSGKLGVIQAIESANGFVEKAGEWRLNRKLAGGGPLMDVGIYSLNACRYLTGEEPNHLQGYSSVIDHDGRFDEVEENLCWTMKFPSGVVASCNTTYGANMPGFYRVHGSKGMLHVEPAFGYQGQHLMAEIHGETPIDEPNANQDPSQFAREADYFSQCILEDKNPKSDGEEGLRDMRYMEIIYKSAGIKLS